MSYFGIVDCKFPELHNWLIILNKVDKLHYYITLVDERMNRQYSLLHAAAQFS